MRAVHTIGRWLLVVAVILMFAVPALAGRWDVPREDGRRAGTEHSEAVKQTALCVKKLAIEVSQAERHVSSRLVQVGLDGLAGMLRWLNQLGIVEVRVLPSDNGRPATPARGQTGGY